MEVVSHSNQGANATVAASRTAPLSISKTAANTAHALDAELQPPLIAICNWPMVVVDYRTLRRGAAVDYERRKARLALIWLGCDMRG